MGHFFFLRLFRFYTFFHLQPITEDDVERLCVCLRALADKSKVLGQVFGEQSREALVHMLSVMEDETKKDKVGHSRSKNPWSCGCDDGWLVCGCRWQRQQ